MEFQYYEDPEANSSNSFETPTTRRAVSRLPLLLNLDGDENGRENSSTPEEADNNLEESKRSSKRNRSDLCPPTVLLAPRKCPRIISNSKPLTSSVLLPQDLNGGGVIRTLTFKKPSSSASSKSLSTIFGQKCDR